MSDGFSMRSLEAGRSERPMRRTPPIRPRPSRGPSGKKPFFRRLWEGSRRERVKRFALIGGGVGVVYFGYLFLTLPDISDPRSLIAAQSSVIVDRNGTELYRLYSDEDRRFIDGASIPVHMKQAIVAIEDERFYDRGCLDIQALARVVFRFGQAGGASTITRQLARNALDLKQENIINRKLKELILGCQLEARYEKDELLDLYLNWIPFGHNAHGIELASRTYFNQPAKDLTLPQAAILASLPQRPSYFSPYGKHVYTQVDEQTLERIRDGRITKTSQIDDEAVTIGLIGREIGSGGTLMYIGGRTDQVLRNMQDLGFIEEGDRLLALEELRAITFEPSRENIRAPHFVLWVRSQAEALLSEGAEEGILDQGGLTIETTLDWDMQQAAQQAVTSKHEDIARLYNAHNISLVSVETGTNEIRAYVGNADFNDEEFDGKVDMARAPRQPGSSFKPLVYAAAFEKGYGPATVLYDVPTKIGEDEPQNFDAGFWGLMSVRSALGASRNIPAAKAFFLAGGEKSVLDFVLRLGIQSPGQLKTRYQEENPAFEYGWPLALGAAETPLLEMVQGYATLANGGDLLPVTSIRRIKDRRGNILYESPAPKPVRATDPRIAYQITSILSDVSVRPNDYWKSVLSVPGFTSAAKTGTSNKCLRRNDDGNCIERTPSDLWTMGYTPNLVTGVWIGNADSTGLNTTAESLVTAAPIWKEYMTAAHALLEEPSPSFRQPSGMVQPQISTLSGELPTECTPIANRKSDLFLQEHAPTTADSACVQLMVDRVTGLLASPECPAEAAEMRSFFAPSSILPERFPAWNRAVQEWAARQTGGYDPVTGTYTGSTLPLPLAPTEQCRLSLTPGRTQRPSVEIVSPRDGGSATYPSFQVSLDASVGSGVREVVVSIDGKQVAAVTEGSFASIPVNVPRSVSESGRHTLRVTLVDRYFNTATAEADFSFEEDTDAPDVDITSPRNGDRFASGETIVIEADAEDGEGGVKFVEFFLDGRLLSTRPVSPYQLNYPQNLDAGRYTLRAVATDFAGNKREDEVDIEIE